MLLHCVGIRGERENHNNNKIKKKDKPPIASLKYPHT